MAKTISGINPRVLAWARHQAGLSVDAVADRMRKDPATIDSWESGESAPTYVQLERLAYNVFHRPLALFFFPEPPDEPDLERSFRTLPAPEAENLTSDTRYKIREARAYQLALYDLTGGANPAARKIFLDITVNSQASATDTAETVRSYLNLEVELRSQWRTASDWFKYCRSVVEDAGVYVFKNSFKQKEVSGFCLYDSEFPIVYINNSTAPTRQIFTLFHELGHILLHTNGVTKLDDDYITSLDENDKRIEVFCNRFAAEVLVPEADFRIRVGELLPDEDLVGRLAREYKASRETILLRFLDLGRVSRREYERMARQWNQEYEESRSGKSGGDYYATKMSYLGDKYVGLALGRHYEGAVSEQRLADLLGVKATNIPNLEQVYLERNVE